jgi:dihydroflavonol-4-reductase
MDERVYLVTGAAGFLGGTICRRLVEEGKKVRAFVLTGDPSIKFLPEEVEVVEGNLVDIDSLEPLFAVSEGTETVMLHIASLVSVNPDFDQRLIDINVGGTKNVIDLCLAHPECTKMVYCSSIGAIPETPKGTPISEVDYFDETKVVGCYSMSKALASQEVLDAVHHRGLNACIVHPSGIMGPGDYAMSDITHTLIDILNGEMPSGIDGSFNIVDVRDLADGCIAAVDKGRTGECYILANEVITFREFADMAIGERGGEKMKLFLPIEVAEVMGHVMEAAAKVTGDKPLLTSFNIYNLARNNDFDTTKAREELGYTTRPYKETIHDMVTWLIEQGALSDERAEEAPE